MPDKNSTNYHLGPQKVREDMQSSWEIKWTSPDYSPPWQSNTPPDELIKAVNDGRFRKGQTILDIGCGLGSMSAWLANQGCKAMGIDFSQNAVERARDIHSGIDDLTFQTVDVSGEFVDIGTFDGLFDRGCFHTIPLVLRPQYVKNIAALANKNAPFLMLYKVPPSQEMALNTRQLNEARYIKNLFDPWFEQKVVRPTIILNHDKIENKPNWSMPGISVWMVRR